MKQLYQSLFLFVLLLSVHQSNAKVNCGYLDIEKKNTNIVEGAVALPTATMKANATSVCLNGTSPILTFTGIGGAAPYTFTYKLNGVLQTAITTLSGDSVTLNVPITVSGIFNYELVSVKDSLLPLENISGIVDTVVVNAIPEIPLISANGSTTFCEGQSVLLSTNNSSGINFQWNLNGVAIPNATSNTYSAVNNGNYSVSLTNTNGCVVISSPVSVLVYTKIEPVLVANGSTMTSNFQNITYFSRCLSSPTGEINIANQTLNQEQVSSYTINWGDGTPALNLSSFSSNTKHIYNQGFYTLNISLKTKQGCEYSKSYGIFVGNSPSGSLGNPGNLSGCGPKTIVFPIIAPAENVPGTQYIIDFGDGESIKYVHPNAPAFVSHTYTNSSCGNTPSGSGNIANSFVASMTIINPCFPSAYTTVGPIIINTPPTPNFTVPPNSGCLNEQISILNTSNPGSIISSTGCNSNSSLYWEISPATGWTATGLGNNGGNANDIDSWSNGVNSPSIKFNIAGTYTIALFVGNNCDIKNITKTICISPPLTPQFILNKTEGCIPLQVIATNSTAITNQCTTPTYLWEVTYASANCGTTSGFAYINGTDKTSASPSFNFTQPGNYSIKLTTTNSCGSVTSIPQVVTIKKPPTVSINSIADFCQNVKLKPLATVNLCTPSAIGNTYLWTFTGGTPNTATTAEPPAVSYATAGSYSVSLAVTNDCGTTTATSNTFLVQAAPLVQNETIAICSNTVFSILPSNATIGNAIPVGTTYSWNVPGVTGGMTGGNSGTGQTKISGTLINSTSITQTATYTITPKVGNCLGTPFNLIVAVNPTPTITGTLQVCIGSTTTLTGSGNPALSNPWISSSPTIATVNNAGIVTGVSAGTSTITYTNLEGCQNTITITVNPLPTVTVNSPVVCSGLSATVIATPATSGIYTYVWIVPAGFTNPGSVASFPTTVAGSYSVTIKNNTTTCESSSASGTVSTNALPNLIITDPNAVCSPSKVDLTSANITLGSDPGLTFTYWKNNTATMPLNNESAITLSGTYFIKALNTNGCSVIKPVVIVINPMPVLPTVNSVSYCQNAISISLTATSLANHTLNWYTTAIGGVPLTAAPTPSTASVGTVSYYVSQTNTTTACEGMRAIITVTVNALPTVTVNNPVVCSGLSATVTATPGTNGNYTYVWIVPAGFTNPGNVASFPTTIAGEYSVIIKNTLTSCTSSSALGKVTTNALPNLLITDPSAVCSPKKIDITDSSITLGSDPELQFTYWKNNTATMPLTNEKAIILSGTYFIRAENKNGCSLIKPVVVVVNKTPSITAIPNSVKCNNQANGIVNFSSDVIGASFAWTNDSPSIGLVASGTGNIPSFTALNSTTNPIIATIKVTATANDCTSTIETFTITVNPIPTVNQPTNQEVCNGSSTAAISFTGNIPETIYTWTNNNTSIGLASSGTGDILSFKANNATSTPIVATLKVTPSINGCTGTPKSITITVNPSPAVTFSPSPQTICSGDSSALVTLNSTTSGVTFAWTTTQPAGISEAIQTSGTTSIPAQLFTNTTNEDIIITYTATATIAGGVACFGAVNEYVITVKPKPSITTALAQTICSNSAFSITPLNGAGNNVPVTTIYTWSNPVVSPLGAITGTMGQNIPQLSISQTLVNGTDQTATATYAVTPKSGNCVGLPFQVVITVSPSPKVVFSANNQTICSGIDSSLINLSSVTSGNVTFNWIATIPAGITGAITSGNGIIPIQTLINSTSNPLTIIYTATATFDDNGLKCSGPVFIYKITVNPSIITSSVKSNFNGFNVSTVGATDGFINVTVTGGSGTYTYLWSGPNGFSASSQNISNVAAGEYTLTIKDGSCNPVVLTIPLSAPMPMLIQEDISAHIDISCNGYLTGSLKVAITQQSIGPYKYELILQGQGIVQSSANNVATNYTFPALKAGTYTIQVTDANGSVKTIQGIVITEPPGITAVISSSTNVLCFGDNTGTATVTASGGSGMLTYSWDTIPTQTTATATGLKAGTYTVTITDAKSCSTSKQILISEPPILTTAISTQTNILCFGNKTGAATISVSGGKIPYTFSWDTSPIITAASATGLASGTYTVTVTDANNCVKVQQVTITQPTAGLGSTISSFNNVSCFGGNNASATVTATNGTLPYTYSWNTLPVQTTATATGLKKGNYSVTVTDFNGCTSTSLVQIEQPLAISTSIAAQTNVACSGNNTGSATIVPIGGTAPYTYSWDTPIIQTSATGVNLAMGTYNVTVTDANNCSTIQQVIITEPNGIVTTISSQTNVACFGKNTGSATIAVSGGTAPLTYSWDTVTTNTTLNASGLAVGIYRLTVTDANGCQKVQQVTITEPAAIVITTNLEKDITCFGDSDGAIKITVSGGTPVYSYSWTKNGIPYSVIKDLSGLSPGTYEVTVSDANNCGPKKAIYVITQPAVLKVSLVNQTNILCFGVATGNINVNVVGGTTSVLGYRFAWTGPNGFTSTTQNLGSVFAGKYDLLITDDSGCTDVLSVVLTQPTIVAVSIITTPITCYGGNNASINLTISGGIAPYTVLWDNLGVGIFQDNLTAGDYIATITDSNNCVKKITINIPEAPVFKTEPIVTQISCFGANDGSIKLNLVGGIPIVKLVWSDNSTAGTTRNNLKPGTYTATIIDGKPCQIIKTFVIIEPQPLVLAANVTNALDCNDANSGAVNLLVSGGSAPFTYAWSNGSTTEDLTAIPAGNYLVTVTDARKCTATGSYSVVRPSPIVAKVDTVTDFNCETKVIKQSFVAKVSGGIPPYQYVWSSGIISGPNNEIMNTSQNGLVVLNAIDSRGCKTTYTFDVAIPELGTPSFKATSIGFNTYGFYAIEDPIQFTNTATGDYTNIAWDFGNGTFSNEKNPIHIYKKEGNYTVRQTVTYPFGCVYVSTISINIDKGYRLIPPTGFTPNNDGVNDYFGPVVLGLSGIQFDVYDTWGALIYSEKGDTIRGWDGKIKNKEAENGNYYFKITAKTFYGKTIKDQGAVLLIK